MSVTIGDVIAHLEETAPVSYQESYDNSGLLTGSASWPVTGVLVTLDCTEAVVDEAIGHRCNLIVAHHPVIFKGLKRLTGATHVERTVLKAVRGEVAIYAIHTNLDNVASGVNRKICEKIGLVRTAILSPRADTLSKLVTFVPSESHATVLAALYAAGAGQIGEYKDCSFSLEGTGTFTPSAAANPAIGERGRPESVTEVRTEVIFPTHLASRVLQGLRSAHPYEEVAYYLTSLGNVDQTVGAGMVGELATPMEPMEFLRSLKERMQLSVIRHTRPPERPVRKVAVCGGAGSFLLSRAKAAGADVFVTADFKYHEFFDAEDRLTIADIGHYESEVFTKDLIIEVLTKKFRTFAINFSTVVTNPISYL